MNNKLENKLIKYKNDLDKWDLYFSTPKTDKYTKEIEAFDRKMYDYTLKQYKKVEDKLKAPEIKIIRLFNEIIPHKNKPLSIFFDKENICKAVMSYIPSHIIPISNPYKILKSKRLNMISKLYSKFPIFKNI